MRLGPAVQGGDAQIGSARSAPLSSAVSTRRRSRVTARSLRPRSRSSRAWRSASASRSDGRPTSVTRVLARSSTSARSRWVPARSQQRSSAQASGTRHPPAASAETASVSIAAAGSDSPRRARISARVTSSRARYDGPPPARTARSPRARAPRRAAGHPAPGGPRPRRGGRTPRRDMPAPRARLAAAVEAADRRGQQAGGEVGPPEPEQEQGLLGVGAEARGFVAGGHEDPQGPRHVTELQQRLGRGGRSTSPPTAGPRRRRRSRPPSRGSGRPPARAPGRAARSRGWPAAGRPRWSDRASAYPRSERA